MPERRSARLRSHQAAPSTATAATYTEIDHLGEKSSARRLYDVQELRSLVFDFLDSDSLANMMRVEKAGIASVAAVLYREVNLRSAPENRGTARRKIYCNAVRVIDISPLATFDLGSAAQALKLKSLPGKIRKFRKRFPSLRTILHLRPLSAEDDIFSLQLGPGITDIIRVDVQSHILLQPDLENWPERGVPELPLVVPVREGFEFRQTFLVDLLIWNGRQFEEDDSDSDGDDPLPEDKWMEWLYSPTVDKRIATINLWWTGEVDDAITYDNYMKYCFNKRPPNCLPQTHCAIPNYTGTMTLSRFKKLLATLGPTIKTILLDGSISRYITDWQSTFAALDAAFPLLETLIIRPSLYCKKSFELHTATPAFPHLRKFQFDQLDVYHLDLTAEMFSNFGTRDCIYTSSDSEQRGETDMLHRLVRMRKSRYFEREAYLKFWHEYKGSEDYKRSRP